MYLIWATRSSQAPYQLFEIKSSFYDAKGIYNFQKHLCMGIPVSISLDTLTLDPCHSLDKNRTRKWNASFIQHPCPWMISENGYAATFIMMMESLSCDFPLCMMPESREIGESAGCGPDCLLLHSSNILYGIGDGIKPDETCTIHWRHSRSLPSCQESTGGAWWKL